MVAHNLEVHACSQQGHGCFAKIAGVLRDGTDNNTQPTMEKCSYYQIA